MTPALRQANFFTGNDPSRCVTCGCDLVANGGGQRAGKGMYQCGTCRHSDSPASVAGEIAHTALQATQVLLPVQTHSPAPSEVLERSAAIQSGYGVPWLLFGRLHPKQPAIEVVEIAVERYTAKHGKPPTACVVGDDSYPDLAALGHTVVTCIFGMTLRVDTRLKSGQVRVGRPGEAA